MHRIFSTVNAAWFSEPKNLIIYLAGINLVTFLAFISDKRQARKKGFRVPEKILLLLVLFGGTLAAWATQKIFRHKLNKRSFRVRFWIIAAVQAAGAIYYFAGY